MNKKIIIGVVVLVLIVGGLIIVNLNKEPEITGEVVEGNELERKLLIVGESWPPMTFEEDGVAKGAHVDIVDLVMKEIGILYEIQFVPWSRAVKMVEEGKADVLLTASYTEERDEWAYFSEDQKLAQNKVLPKAYLDAMDMVFFIPKMYEGMFKFDSFEQITADGYRIGLDANYAYVDAVLEADWDTTYRHTIPDNFQALYDGTIDMYLQDKINGLQMIKELGLEDEITYINKPVMTFIYYLPFSKNSDYPDIKRIWEQTLVELEEIQESGVVDEIYERYI